MLFSAKMSKMLYKWHSKYIIAKRTIIFQNYLLFHCPIKNKSSRVFSVVKKINEIKSVTFLSLHFVVSTNTVQYRIVPPILYDILRLHLISQTSVENQNIFLNYLLKTKTIKILQIHSKNYEKVVKMNFIFQSNMEVRRKYGKF